MKKGFHSTQDKVWNTIPRSEFLGVAIGLAIGMIVHGALQMDSSLPEIVGAAIGFSIGYLIDRGIFLEKNVSDADAPQAYSAVEEPACTDGDIT